MALIPISRATRVLINTASIAGLVWIATVIYQSIAGIGLWRIVESALSGEHTRANPAAVFAACVLAGAVVIGGVAWLIWRLLLRGRSPEDFPDARVQRRK